tara:strand:- start:11435 stop:12628 length:1194 start_codon:yes stop_codon:yes gene_type:complete
MAIQTFKQIIDNQAFRISAKDRAIFEQGTLQSFFGFSDSDMIEFIVYDVNDNQLPQGEFGELVRYVPLNSQNINDYFLIADNTLFQALQFPNEYFIDIERLLKESGYDNGIFKTQITLLNKRVGFESANEKMWIKQISPSRTEVKLLPLINDVSKKTDLLQRFNIFINGGDFKDDVIQYVPTFLESINPSIVDDFIKRTYSEVWYNKLVTEFGIAGLDTLATKIHTKFVEAVKYEFANRESSIKSPLYGNKKSISLPLQLSADDVFKIAQIILIEIVQVYLPMRTIQTKTEIDAGFDESKDDVGTLLQRRESDVMIGATPAMVMVKKQKTEVSNPTKDISIKDAIPVGIPIPVFSKPNPVKSTVISPDPVTIATPSQITSTSTRIVSSGGGGISRDS